MDRLLVDASVIGPTLEKGAQRYARELSEELGRQGDVEVRVLVRKGARRFSPRSSANVFEVDIRRRRTWLMHGLDQYAKRNGFGTVLVAGEGPALLHPSRRLFIAAHEVPRELVPSCRVERPSSSELVMDRVTGRALRSSVRVFALSSFMAGCLTAHYRLDPSRVMVVAPGVSPCFLATPARQETTVKFALAFSTGDSREHPAVAIEAIQLAETSIERLVLVGSNGSSFLEGAAPGGLEVQALGRVDDLTLRDLYASATCYIETSSYEGYGLQVAEALAQGCPVFLRRLPVFQEFGLEGLQYWDGSPKSLADRLTSFEKSQTRNDHRKKLGISRTWNDAVSDVKAALLETR